MLRLILSYSASESPGSLYTKKSESAYMLGTRAAQSGLTIEVHTSASNHGIYVVISMLEKS